MANVSHRDQPLERYLRACQLHDASSTARQLQECLAPATQAAPVRMAIRIAACLRLVEIDERHPDRSAPYQTRPVRRALKVAAPQVANDAALTGAVELSPEGEPRRIRLAPIVDFSARNAFMPSLLWDLGVPGRAGNHRWLERLLTACPTIVPYQPIGRCGGERSLVHHHRVRRSDPSWVLEREVRHGRSVEPSMCLKMQWSISNRLVNSLIFTSRRSMSGIVGCSAELLNTVNVQFGPRLCGNG